MRARIMASRRVQRAIENMADRLANADRLPRVVLMLDRMAEGVFLRRMTAYRNNI